jgi:membrane-associated phospholipid phosphatase
MHDYFNFHQDCLPSPGYTDGLFYQLVEDAKAAGERPTAAFPSSHVGISTVIMWLIIHARNWRLLYVVLPFYVLLCCSTVYIQAHYLIDAIFGLISGTIFYFVLLYLSKGVKRS